MTKFKVGDKVQTTEGWGCNYSHAIITESNPSLDYVICTWYYINGYTNENHQIKPYLLYLLKSSGVEKKGLCKFLDKVKKEYSNG